MTKRVVVLGAGLAGLSCAYEMARAGLHVTVLEREPQVGGMAASFEEGDRSTAGQEGSDYYSHDFGPHRFHSYDEALMAHVREILGGNAVSRKRSSRIFLFGRYFDYPLAFANVLRNFPPLLLARALADYGWIRMLDRSGLRRFEDRNFHEWVERRFGSTLARIFFVEYTEKSWGIPAREISPTWARQRITLLDLWDTIVKTVLRPRQPPRTLVTDFVYPNVGGIGELARGYARCIEELGGEVIVDAPALRLHRQGQRITQVEYRRAGERRFLEADEYVSTIPITAMARSVVPAASREVREAIRGLGHVAIVFIYLKLDRPQVTGDHWIYLPQKTLTVHRVSEFKNFSPRAAPAGRTQICAEITCRVGDAIWRAQPDALREIAVRDLAGIGLFRAEEVLGSHVRRIPFAYPLYDLAYEARLRTVLEFVSGLENIVTGGRQGLFRYNNMDQSIEMGRRVAAGALGREGAEAAERVATEQRYFG